MVQSKRLLGVDVDLTVCPSDSGWLDWLVTEGSEEEAWNQISCLNVDLTSGYTYPYDLGSMFPSIKDPYDYWRTLDYSKFKPLVGSVEKLQALSEHFDIVFISQPKGTHSKSKYYWLKEHFPFMKGYIATKEKFLMNDSVVAMVDDRLNVLNGFQPYKRVLFKTPYTQTVDCTVAYEIYDWTEFDVNHFLRWFL